MHNAPHAQAQAQAHIPAFQGQHLTAYCIIWRFKWIIHFCITSTCANLTCFIIPGLKFEWIMFSSKSGDCTEFSSNPFVLAVCHRPDLGPNIKVDGLQRFFSPGVELVLSCELGYTPVLGPRKIVCGASGTWTKSKLICMREFTLF